MSNSAAKSPESQTPTLREAAQEFGRLVDLVRPYWGELGKGLSLGPLAGLVGLVPPYITKLLIDEVYVSQDVTFMHVLVFGLLGARLGQAFFDALVGYYNAYVNTKMNTAARLLFFNHLQHLPVSFFDNHRVGEVTSRFQDVGDALGSVTHVFQTLASRGVYLVIVPPVLFILDWRLALVALIATPLSVGVTSLASSWMRSYWRRSSEAYADLNAIQVETLSQIRTLKTMGLEHTMYRKAHDQVDEAMDQRMRAEGVQQGVRMLNLSLYGANVALYTWLGWTFILSGGMTLGSYVAFTSYVEFLYAPLREMVRLFSQFQQSAVHLRRMFEYLDEPTEQDPSNAWQPPGPIERPIRGGIQFDDVTFGYDDEEVLKEISIEIEPGDTVAVVGPSGTGKTSMMRLIARMNEPWRGTLRIDRTPIQDIPLRDLRRQLSVVWQEFRLLRGTIRTNLTLGNRDVTRGEIDRALRLCHVDDLVANSKDGLDTSVAEWGATLSSGQRQRLALARALLRDAPVVLLDEATSNIDQQTEAKILDDLFAELEDTTVVFITHRVETAPRADRICSIHDGRVVGYGTHEELIETCPEYRALSMAS